MSTLDRGYSLVSLSNSRRLGCENFSIVRSTEAMSRILVCYALVSVMMQQLIREGYAASNDSKIAFLFLVRGRMPLEDIWREFFGWRANTSLYTVYVHVHQGFKYDNQSVFYGKEIRDSIPVKWGDMGQVRAIKSLVRQALEDPLNKWFCLMSETCIPLHPFPVWVEAFRNQEKSMVNACAMDRAEMETDTRWRPSLDKVQQLSCMRSNLMDILY